MSTATLTDKDLRVRDAVMQQLEWDPAVDASAIGVSAHEGGVTLTGTVDWHYQRLQAEKAVRYIRGVRHVIDHIAVVPRAAGKDMHRRIAQALYRNATLDARRIQVTVTGSVAHLRGTATSWLQRQAAERAAYDAPGITLVDNQIIVDPPDGDVCEIC